MRITPNITYRGIDKTDAIDSLIHEKIEKMEQFYQEITSCRVSVEKIHDHPDGGSPYKVRLDITVPESREVVVNEKPKEGVQYVPLEAVIRDAFETANRQLRELNEQQHNHMKTHIPGKREIILDDVLDEPNVPAADATVS